MTLLRTVIIFLALSITILFFIPLGLLTFVLRCLGLRQLMDIWVYQIARLWARMILKISGCRLTVSGREFIPKKGGVCFVSNHVGIFDIVLALALIGRPFGFIAKKELLILPLINIWIALLGGLFIDRAHPRKALKTINKGVERLKAGGSMLIFPEGHRSRGQGLQPFHPGSLKLAAQSGVPIVPIAITGSYEVFEKNYMVHPVPVRVVFSPTIVTADIPHEERKKRLSDQVYAVIEAALER
jgi:1-acyl-sn-glycerol-3-phosphate acyltransferase